MNNAYVMSNIKVLMAHLVHDAVRIYTTGKHTSNVTVADFPAPWVDALTFLHGDRAYTAIEDAIGDDYHGFLTRNGIPQPGSGCACFACRTEYVAEAQAAAALVSGRRRRFCFKIGSQHHVYFKSGHLTAILPVGDQDDTWLSPDEYILKMTGSPSPYQEKRKTNHVRNHPNHAGQVPASQGRQA